MTETLNAPTGLCGHILSDFIEWPEGSNGWVERTAVDCSWETCCRNQTRPPCCSAIPMSLGIHEGNGSGPGYSLSSIMDCCYVPPLLLSKAKRTLQTTALSAVLDALMGYAVTDMALRKIRDDTCPFCTFWMLFWSFHFLLSQQPRNDLHLSIWLYNVHSTYTVLSKHKPQLHYLGCKNKRFPLFLFTSFVIPTTSQSFSSLVSVPLRNTSLTNSAYPHFKRISSPFRFAQAKEWHSK